MKKKKAKISAKNLVVGSAALTAAIGIGYVSYLLGSQYGFNKAIDVVVTRHPYMGFIKNGIGYMSKLM